MDHTTDCPICFETFEAETPHQHHTAPCCGQSLCKQCSDCLRRCPFCREGWHGEDAGGGWLRNNFRNPVFAVGVICTQAPQLVVWGAKAAYAGVTSLRAGATTAALLAAEASPIVIGGAVASAVAVVGGVAVVVASRHQEEQACRLQTTIRSRRHRQLAPTRMGYHSSAACLFEVLQWYLAPQKEGMPHVYHGSLWRSEARERYLSQVEALCVELPPGTNAQTPSDKLWDDLTFGFSAWLQYNPHTANWGTCVSYGSPPLNLCWHNRWREDLRHSISGLARRFLAEAHLQDGVSAKEWACAMCLLATLDYVLSWEVSTPEFGTSDVIEADWYRYQNFCQKLTDRFAQAWAAAQAPLGSDISEMDLASLGPHVEVMAAREIPEGFRDVW